MTAAVSLEPLALSERIEPGDDLAAMIDAAAGDLAGALVVIAHTAIAKAEGAVRPLSGVTAGARALEIAERQHRDPRLVQVILDETEELLREERGVLVCVTRHGFVCANAGVDLSNSGADDLAVLLPEDADASARRIRAGLERRSGAQVAVLVADSFGRAWRHGQVDVAIGLAGMAALDDWRGRRDRDGRLLTATLPAVGDAAAAAADLARSKDSGEPVVLVRGLERHFTSDDGPGAKALLRERSEDLFR